MLILFYIPVPAGSSASTGTPALERLPQHGASNRDRPVSLTIASCKRVAFAQHGMARFVQALHLHRLLPFCDTDSLLAMNGPSLRSLIRSPRAEGFYLPFLY